MSFDPRWRLQANLNLQKTPKRLAAHTSRSTRAEDRNLYLLFVPRSGLLVQLRELSWGRRNGQAQEGFRGEECRVRECRNKVGCRDRVGEGKSVRGQAGRQTGGLHLATCYHAKTNLEITRKHIPVDILEFSRSWFGMRIHSKWRSGGFWSTASFTKCEVKTEWSFLGQFRLVFRKRFERIVVSCTADIFHHLTNHCLSNVCWDALTNMTQPRRQLLLAQSAMQHSVFSDNRITVTVRQRKTGRNNEIQLRQIYLK